MFEQQYADSFAVLDETGVSAFHSQIDEVEKTLASEAQQSPDVLLTESRETAGFSYPLLVSQPPRLSTYIPKTFHLEGKWAGRGVAFAGGVMVGALVMYLVLDAKPPKTVTREKLVTKTEIVYRDAPLAESGVDGVASTEQSGDTGRPKRRAGRFVKKTTGTDAPAPSRKQTLLASMNADRANSARAGSGNNGLSARQVSEVVSKNRSTLQVCYERELKKGAAPAWSDVKVTFHANVGTSGTVTGVRMSGSGSQLPGLQKCLGSVVKKWIFPASSAGSSVEFPIVFTPSR